MLRTTFFFLFCLLVVCKASAQQPTKPNATEIYAQIQKLNFLGSVLYIAAHPDDENTRLISYMANQKKARTAYLSLTRGDGGQNLIGPELRELLGVIRTQELLEARRIDGGEQFFSRANDFGYSKNPAETLEIWNKDAVLSDVVYLIRKFQPDVIVNRFDARTPGSTHGHHTASAQLSLEAFDKAKDAKSYPEQLKLVGTWQPKRVFFNTSWWFYGSREKFDRADKSKLYKIPTGNYYASMGKSNQEIAALSRSRHQSQGFGNTGVRGEDYEYLELLKGAAGADKTDVFEGIDTTWNRVKGGKAVGTLLEDILEEFDFNDPSASIPDLLKAYALMGQLEDNHWKIIKRDAVKEIIAACSGLYLEAVAATPYATPGSSVKLKIESVNRSRTAVRLESILSPYGAAMDLTPTELSNNQPLVFDLSYMVRPTEKYTQPYWLEKAGTVGMYTVADQKDIGIPDVIRNQQLVFNISVNGVPIPLQRPVVYKYNDEVKGEVYEPFDIVPEVSIATNDPVAIFNGNKTQKIGVTVTSNQEDTEGIVKLELPENWAVSPKTAQFSLNRKGDSQVVYFEVTAPERTGQYVATAIAIIEGKRYDQQQIEIHYPHITKQQVFKPSQTRLLNLDLKTGNQRIAYLMGAGDEVPGCLRLMGYTVDVLTPESLSAENLNHYDVVMTGIRAYNTVKALASKQQMLLDFVRQGHTMIVQYNTLGDFVTPDFAPYPLKISRDRVTEENAEVKFLDAKHPLLNFPNKITAADFTDWKQEQGLYYPNEWDAAFTPVLSAHDKGESDKKGALLIASYGKGHYIYTGLSFFRELPEGVPGAYRLMANLIATEPSK